jgi:Tol biopolymer transport system component
MYSSAARCGEAAVSWGTLKRRLGAIGAGLVLAIGSATSLAAEAGAGVAETTRVSVSSHEAQANDWSSSPAISANGRFVAFRSQATNLAQPATKRRAHIFVRDRSTGRTSRVSVSSRGKPANSRCSSPSISADGRFVAFESGAPNLVSGDTNRREDVFVHDRQTRETSLVSVRSGGIQASKKSFSPVISANGRFIAFTSKAKLTPTDTNRTWDVYVHDRRTSETSRVSQGSDGVEGNGTSGDADISSSGRFVAFTSDATNLVAGDTNGLADVFVHDHATGETRLVSVRSDDTQIVGPSFSPSISADGRFVAFESHPIPVPGGTSHRRHHIFVRDLQRGRTQVVSRGRAPSISANGRSVAFWSHATNLVAGDNNESPDAFIHDRTTGGIRRVSVPSPGREANGGSRFPALSANRSFVAFESKAGNLVRGDRNRRADIFVRGPLR